MSLLQTFVDVNIRTGEMLLKDAFTQRNLAEAYSVNVLNNSLNININ